MFFLTNGRLFIRPIEILIVTLQQDIASLASLEIIFDHSDFMGSEWTSAYRLGNCIQNSSTLKELTLFEKLTYSSFTDQEAVENAKMFLRCVHTTVF